MSKIQDDIDFAWHGSKLEMVVYKNRFLITKKLLTAAENPMTILPLTPNNQRNRCKLFTAFGFDFDFDLWTSVNMQLDAENVVAMIV